MERTGSIVVFLLAIIHSTSGTIFGIRIRDASPDGGYGAPQPPPNTGYQQPKYNPYKQNPNILSGITGLKQELKEGALRAGSNALRFKGDLFYGGADALDGAANRLNPDQQAMMNAMLRQQRPFNQNAALSLPGGGNIGNLFSSFNNNNNNNNNGGYNSPQPRPSYNNNNNNMSPATIANMINSMEAMNGPTPDLSAMIPDDVIVDPRLNPNLGNNNNNAVDQGLTGLLRTNRLVSQGIQGPKIQQCEEKLTQLIGDIFIGNEMVPDIIDKPPLYPLDLTYRTVRTFPGMRVTAETTRYKPMLHWPAEDGALYTLVVSNLDINTRRNRTLSEFWHWFVANIPGDSVDDGEVVFDLLFPLVLPEGNGDHRFGYFVMKQPRALDYRDEGGPTDSCSPNMSNGRGPKRSTMDFMKKYGLELTAATFLIIDSDKTSLDIACKWQQCMGGQVFVRNLDCL